MFKRGKNPKAQSAMEYLMTYGWAILIIAVVLGALFSLGVFSSGSFLGTTCIASSGYECISPLLHSGNFIATFGQSTGTNWVAGNVFFVGNGAPSPSVVPTNTLCSAQAAALSSGQSVSLSLTGYVSGGSPTAPTCSAFPSTVGSTEAGSLWVEYQTSSGGPQLFSQVATVTLKAS
jgi:hypothetical protein